MSVISYARYSPRPNDSDSCQVQLADIRRWCEEHGLEIRAEFVDEQVSGGLEPHEVKRAGLWAALSALKAGDVLVVRDLSRLARDAIVSAAVEKSVKKAGATIRSIRGQGTEDDSPQSRLMRRIHQAFAEYEREMIRSITSAKMRMHQKNGRLMSKKVPYGFESFLNGDGKKHLRKNDEEQRILQEIYRLHDEEGLGAWKIAEQLNEWGVTSRGGQWYGGSVRRILKRRERE